MSKTLGQVAYESHWKASDMYPDNLPKDWGTLPSYAQHRWQAAAEAVVDAYDGPAHSRKSRREAIIEQQFYSPMSPTTDKEQAVIEAARAWRVRPGIQRRIDNLVAALEALDSGEE